MWVCNFCQQNNNVENYYYSPLSNGYRNDFNERKELQYGSVDFIASSDYMNRPPMAPTYVFVFDVSKTAIESGYLEIVTQTIKRSIEEGSIPGGERTRVGFLTFDDTIHYYNLKSTLRQPQVIVNTETDFLPVPDELIVNLEDSKSLILDLLDNLPVMFSESTVFESNLGAAVKSIGMISKATGGKVFVFDGSPISSKFPHLRPTDKPGV